MKKQTDIIKSLIQVVITLSLVIVILITCISFSFLFFTAAWIHTYNAFTGKDKIAEVHVKPLGKDERGFDKFELTITEYKKSSALIVGVVKNDNENKTTVSKFTMFGDTFFVEAHVVKLPDFFTLLNYKAIYKITGIEGDYVNNRDLAKQIPSSERSIYDLNGGVDKTWKWIKDNESQLKFIIDTAEVTRQGKTITNEEKTYEVFITEEGLLVQ